MLTQALKATPEYKKLLDAVTGGQCPAALFGLPPAGRAQMLCALAEDIPRPFVLLCPGEAEATRFAQDLTALGLAAAVYPARDFVLRNIESQNHEYEYRRLQVLGDLVGGRVRVLCASAEGALQHTMPKAEFLRNTLTLRPEMELPQKELTARLHAAGYYRRDRVEGPGQFSVRGGIVDIYAPDMTVPARLEYWGDVIDSIHSFDLMSQRRDKALEKIYLSPAREVLFGAAQESLQFLSAAIEAHKGKAKEQLARAAESELAQLRAGLMPASMDKFLPLRYPVPATVLDYVNDPVLFLDEPGGIREALDTAGWRFGEEVRGLLEEGVLSPQLTAFYGDWGDLVQLAHRVPAVLQDNFTRTLSDFSLKTLLSVTCHSLPVWNGVTAGLAEDLQPLLEQGYFAAVLAGTERSAASLAKDLAAAGIHALVTGRDVTPRPGCAAILTGHLSGGVEYPFARFALFTGRAAGASVSAAPKRKAKPGSFSTLEDLKPGDDVVHHSHGVGRYVGIQRLDLHGVVKDYFKISYDKGDNLYVPVTQLDLLSRYDVQGDGEKVKLARLGGSEWQRTKTKARAATQEIAGELVQLYAKRQSAAGYAFDPDTEWQRDFEARFEYDETDDQLLATAEIKRDMEKAAPMDRLLCGDVGVGKTEVALRAAFKAVMSGKQVAILVPTTILAWQHYQTILRRMEAFPVNVGLLNRFRTPAQQKQTLRDLADGVCEIVVGTHRLLQKDVKFRDLGLLIIDEEQRFGVKHKEKLKETFVGVDTLTLSATPIPRTLNMAMNGIRDLSSIQQPPFERQPIETYVLEHDDRVVEQAIRKELGRGGQVYYLHNRVDTITHTAARLQQAIPEARIGVAHGQMEEKELSAIWQQLLNNELDILVCTTIIETGVDVRNCNTLIVENADMLGLSQLYQIRGRVGRSGRKAYAYFTFQRDKVLSEISTKRLGAIREFTSFGSGLRIAMRDMQIRGVGNLLGASQHGHIQSVGYDLYMKLLGKALAEAKGEPLPPDKSECIIDITVDAYIPEKYIAAASGRIEAYKRIAAIEDKEDMEDVLAELTDRYGPVPECVRALTQVSFVRVGAAELGIYEVGQRGENLLLYSDGITRALVRRLLPALGRRAAVNAGAKPYLSVALGKEEAGIEVLTAVLEAWRKAKEQAADDPPEPETPAAPAAPANNGLFSARSTGAGSTGTGSSAQRLNTAPAHTVRASHYGGKKR